ncbi:MAG: histidine phosphatase family protein [Kangiellaceae bacterium]|nr:histidine phosphatase family protein [Kangiellaceae bacterium]
MLNNLWIMRHGLAVEQFETDFSRALSKTGELQADNVAEQLLAAKSSLPTEMLVSPFARTISTANIVHRKLALKNSYKTDEMLVHFADHKILGDFLLASEYQHLLIVSHMPIVARLCQYLAPACEIYGFQTAQVVRLDFEQTTSDESVVKVSQIILPEK